MTPSDDLSPPRRPIFFPVVIATVFLTIIAMTAGFVLGERHRGELNSAQEQSTAAPQPTVEPSPSPALTGVRCPREAVDMARKLGFADDLRQVMKIVTNRPSTAWICRDGAGALYYQSKTDDEGADLVQGRNALFLSGVRRTGDNEYEVRSPDGNLFLVTSERLRIEFATGRNQVDRVIRVEQ